MKIKILVTGFDPFGGEIINPALEAMKAIQHAIIENVEVYTLEVPTVFQKSIAVLKETVQDILPDVVLCLGQAGGTSGVTVERIAVNLDDASICDNEGSQPIDQTIVEGAPTAYFSTLPVKMIVQHLRDASLPASVSNSAGTFVCNHLFYGLSHMIATDYPTMRGGFIHLPYLPEQAVRFPGKPSMSLEQIVHALQISIRTVADYQ